MHEGETLPSGGDRFGLDKEVHERLQRKYDVALEAEAMEWIATLVNEEGVVAPKPLGNDGAALHGWLKDGILLVKLLNAIQPGAIASCDVCCKPVHPLEERQNIQAFLNGLQAIQLPSQDTFLLGDLHGAKCMPAVLQCIYALGRQAQVIPGFTGPKLGVTYSVSLSEQTARKERKVEEQRIAREAERRESDRQLNRRLELEKTKRMESIDDMEKAEFRSLKRKLDKGRISMQAYQQAKSASQVHFEALRDIPEGELEIEIAPVKYGMDIEIEQRMKQRHNTKEEEDAMDWIERVTGREVNNFHEHLKSGRTLCELVNKIRPEAIKRINTKSSPIADRDNIQLYLDACARMGVPRGNLFNVNDLYEKQSLQSVVGNVFALARVARNVQGFPGPNLEQDGSLTPVGNREKVSRSCCVIC